MNLPYFLIPGCPSWLAASIWVSSAIMRTRYSPTRRSQSIISLESLLAWRLQVGQLIYSSVICWWLSGGTRIQTHYHWTFRPARGIEVCISNHALRHTFGLLLENFWHCCVLISLLLLSIPLSINTTLFHSNHFISHITKRTFLTLHSASWQWQCSLHRQPQSKLTSFKNCWTVQLESHRRAWCRTSWTHPVLTQSQLRRWLCALFLQHSLYGQGYIPKFSSCGL